MIAASNPQQSPNVYAEKIKNLFELVSFMDCPLSKTTLLERTNGGDDWLAQLAVVILFDRGFISSITNKKADQYMGEAYPHLLEKEKSVSDYWSNELVQCGRLKNVP